MTWVLLIGVGWLVVALLVGVLIGRGIRLADRKEASFSEVADPNFVVDPASPAPAADVPEPVVSDPEPSPSEPPADAGTPTDGVSTPERARQAIPGARTPARKPVRPPERGSSAHRPGLF